MEGIEKEIQSMGTCSNKSNYVLSDLLLKN